MSALNSLFNRASFGVRCKTCLNLAISRIKLLRNKREVQLKHMRKEIYQYLQSGQEAVARIRVEHIIREQNILAAYEILELFCEFVLARIPILEAQRDCPTELQEAISSIIFASPRCSDMPELLQIRNLFTAKYGKDFASAASELRPDSNVNRTIIEKLSVKAPPSHIKLKVLKAIAKEYNLEWDSSSTEADFSKKHEDLLDGSNPVNSEAHTKHSSVDNSLFRDRVSSLSLTEGNQRIPSPKAPNPAVNNTSASRGTTSLVHKDKEEPDSIQDVSSSEEKLHRNRSSDALDRARVAIAAAERASAAAHAAAELVNVRMSRQGSNTKNFT